MPTQFPPLRIPARIRRLGPVAALGIILMSAAAGSPAAVTDPVATVTGGRIRGRSLGDGPGAVFKGVPFAQPPVGDLRWRPPVPVVGWEGVRDAGQSGPPAAQPNLGWNGSFASASSEDCLYLDVWTPDARPKAPLPVMVWIHGGANVAGAGGFDTLYDGRALIRHGVVLVVIQYRLGMFGFFSHPELTRESPHHSSGNYAILDQVAALQWVHDNIAQAGGDPGNVTIFGQSAGAQDVMALMATPLARGLFHRAIAESGPLPPAARSPALAEAEQAGVAAAAKLGAPGEGALRFLRSLPAVALVRANPGLHGFSADGWVFPTLPADVFARRGEARVPLILGGNAVEFPAEGSPEDLRSSMREVFGDLAPRAIALYGIGESGDHTPVDPLYGNAADQWGSDLFRLPAMVLGEWHDAAGNPTWQYQFDRAIPPRPRTGHSSDLPYVFGNLLTTGSQGGAFGNADRGLSDMIQGYWTNFARTGNPNGPGLPDWPNYDGRARKFLEFTTAAGAAVGENERGPYGDLFREAMNRRAAAK